MRRLLWALTTLAVLLTGCASSGPPGEPRTESPPAKEKKTPESGGY